LDLWPSDVTAYAPARNKEKKYCSVGKTAKQHLLVRGARVSNFKVNTSLNFIPFDFLLMSSGQAIAELVVLYLFWG